MLPWLDREDLTRYIGDVPDSFDSEAKLSPLVDDLVGGWLTDLIGKERVSAYKTKLEAATELTDEENEWVTLIKKFLTYAAWSEYIPMSNVRLTNNGFVVKLNNESDPIEAPQRVELATNFERKAKRMAVRLARKAKDTGDCHSPAVGNLRPTIRVVKGRNDSYFS